MSSVANLHKEQEQANVLRQQAETVRVLMSTGFGSRESVEAVCSGDLSTLIQRNSSDT